MKAYRMLAVMAVAALVGGCVTVTYPDGTVEQRIDYEMAQLGLDAALLAYNLLRSNDVGADVPYDRLGQFLDNVDRALDLVNRIREAQGQPPLLLMDKSGELVATE